MTISGTFTHVEKEAKNHLERVDNGTDVDLNSVENQELLHVSTAVPVVC